MVHQTRAHGDNGDDLEAEKHEGDSSNCPAEAYAFNSAIKKNSVDEISTDFRAYDSIGPTEQ